MRTGAWCSLTTLCDASTQHSCGIPEICISTVVVEHIARLEKKDGGNAMKNFARPRVATHARGENR